MAVTTVTSTAYDDHDHNFIGKVPDKFICVICTKVLRDPHLTGCCGQHYCGSCLALWFTKQKARICPHCRQENFSHLQNKDLTRKISQLEVRCTLCIEGCTWIGALGGLQTHLNAENGCSYVKLKCPNKCREILPLDSCSIKSQDTEVRRMDLSKHLNSECPLRRYKCEYCDHEDTYQKITGCKFNSSYSLSSCHYDECSEMSLNCPNKCGALKIRRKDMPTHREQCPLEPVQCPFQEAGCQTRLPRRDLDNHMNSQTQQHLLLTFQTTRMLRKRCDDFEKKNAELERENADLKRVKLSSS